MLTHLLDTSVYSQRLKPNPLDPVVRRWRSLGDSVLAISSCCEAELLFGLEKRGSSRLWTEYERYLKDQLTLLPFGYAEAVEYARLRRQLAEAGESVACMDLLIGATALANGLVLATLNTRHFARMPGLRVEDWSQTG
ncbi:MAG: PIN domain-containing protein [Verrucomicrobia bacterium]|jgi:tRNA(fMet)-specific endonuclease VapC|nr:PIN domain-containing protein [Verrucomicrobiota bacterium]